MKRILSFLILAFSILSLTAKSQTTSNCDAAFGFVFVNSSTVKFNPVYVGDPAFTAHQWQFGDGASDNTPSPTHSYVSAGTFTVRHIQIHYYNNTLLCRDTVYHDIQINTICNLVVSFTNTVTSAVNTIHFENTSTPLSQGDSIKWSFGDGTFSHEVSPNHTYTQAGTYNVCLIVRKRTASGAVTNCAGDICHSITVGNVCNLVASFVFSNTPGTVPNTFHFENTSTPLNNTDSVRWSFGDGTGSNDISPNHTYTQPGTYNVCLRVQKRNSIGGLTNCVREVCHSVIVQSNCNLVAGFNIIPGNSLNLYYFQNTSTPLSNGDSIRWSFGDGTYSNDVNAVHTYTQSGTFNVCLTIIKRSTTGALTDCIRHTCQTITIQSTCTLVAGFTATPTSATNTIHFENTSTPLNNTDSVRWSFGDGTGSNDISPNHTYTHTGTYNVCLRVQKRNSAGVLMDCVREICHVVTIPASCNLIVSFTVTQMANVLNAFHFENTTASLSSNDSIKWSFGDGTYSDEISPNHIYTRSGTFNVCLTVIKRNANGGLTDCARYTCHPVVIPGTCTLVAGFSTTPTSAVNTIHFENTTATLSNTDIILWHFGDGTTSGDVNPTHTYAQAGTYTVCLRVERPNTAGTPCVSEICHNVTVGTICNLQAHYSWASDPANPLHILFTNQTITPTAGVTVNWSFGDGTGSTDWNASHTYTQPGRYKVCLRVENAPNCVSYSCDSITVHSPGTVSCLSQSNFTFIRAAANSQLYYFIPQYINPNWDYTWTFGDGTGSHDTTVSHTYTQPGIYHACLTVYRNANCASTTCREIRVEQQVVCDSVQVSYSYQHDPYLINKVYFHAISNYPVLDQTWTITKLPTATGSMPITLHQNNPSFTFQDTGYYRVCLKATTAGNCIKEYCQIIHIGGIPGTTNCSLQIYPNPATSYVNLSIYLAQPEQIDIYVYNSLNVLVKEKHQAGVAGANLVYLPIADLLAGSYYVKVIHGNSICYGRIQKF